MGNSLWRLLLVVILISTGVRPAAAQDSEKGPVWEAIETLATQEDTLELQSVCRQMPFACYVVIATMNQAYQEVGIEVVPRSETEELPRVKSGRYYADYQLDVWPGQRFDVSPRHAAQQQIWVYEMDLEGVRSIRNQVTGEMIPYNPDQIMSPIGLCWGASADDSRLFLWPPIDGLCL